MSMEFHDWLENKFIEWRGDSRKTVTQFASYLEISQPTVSAWINNTRGKPTSSKIISALASKLGSEIYDILGMPREAGDENDQLISNKTRHMTPEKKRQVLEFIRTLEYLDVPNELDSQSLTSSNLVRIKK